MVANDHVVKIADFFSGGWGLFSSRKIWMGAQGRLLLRILVCAKSADIFGV